MTLQQSTADRIVTAIADHTGLCWLSLILWKDGIFGRSHWPVRRCRNCNYCGKHLGAGQ